MAAAMKHMASNFAKLEKFEGVDFQRWQKKMHFLLSSMSVVYVLTTPMPEDGGLILNGMSDSLFEIYQNVETFKEVWDTLETIYMGEDASSKKFLVSNFTNYKMTDSRPVLEQYNELLGIRGRFTQHKMNIDESIQFSCIIDKLPPSWKDFKHTLKHLKEELTLVELGSHLRIKESPRAQDNDKPKGNNVVGPSVVNMVEHNNSFRKPGHLKKDCKASNVGDKANGSGTKGSVDGSSNSLKGQNMFNKSFQVYYVTYVSEAYFVQDDDVAWWVDSRETVHVCKDRCWFKTSELLNDGSILHILNESTALVHGRGYVDLRFSSGKVVSLLNVLHVPNIRKNLVSSSVLNNYGYKQVTESNKFVLSKHGVFIGFGYLSNHMFRLNIVSDNIDPAFTSTSKLNDSILWHARLGHVHFKRMQDMSKDGLIPAFDMDTGKCKTCMLTKITKKLFQNVKCGIKVLELIHSNLCDLHATPSLGNKKYFVTFIDDAFRFCYVYLLHSKYEALDKFKVFKTEVELQQGSLIKRFRTNRGGEYMDTLYFQSVERGQGFWGEAMAVVRLPDPKLKTLGERGIECIFVGYVEHSKAFRFYVIEPNESVAINSIIESKDAIFDENRLSSVPRPCQRSLVNGIEDSGGSVVPEKVTDEDDPKTFDEAMKSQDVAFWKAAINDKMNSIMGKAGHSRLQTKMDVKTSFLNGELEEEVNPKKEFLSSRFSMKDMGEANVILGIRIKHESNGILISQSHYIEKVLKKFNYFDCTPISTPIDTSEKLMPNNDQAVSQLEYSRVIGCLMYAMTCTRPDIAFAMGKLSKYTSNPGTQHWQAIQRVLKYLKKTMDYRWIYTGYPLVLEGYTDASWISNTEDNSSTSGWVFLLGGGAISWASKKQTCITGSIMESGFVALAAAG
ncbi:zinc finger, CCHC-type containing protein [Tanacetum coccineum]